MCAKRVKSAWFWLMAAVFTFGLTFSGPRAGKAAEGEIRIGFLAPTTGGWAQIGRNMIDGFEMYLDQIGHKMAGRKVVFIIEDTRAKPPTAVTKARKLILQDKADILVGGVLASVGYALAPIAANYKVPYLMPITGSDDLTQRLRSPWVIRTGYSSSQAPHVFGQYAYEAGYRRVVTFSADYAYGYEIVGGFQQTFEKAGGQVIQKIWPPLGALDLAPFVAQINRKADAVFLLLTGPMPAKFFEQYAAAGLKGKIPLIGDGIVTDEFILPYLGDSALGFVGALHYSTAIQTPMNEAFVKRHRAKFNRLPSMHSESTFTTAAWIDQTLQKMGSKFTKEDFVKTFRTVRFESPRGPVSLDDYGNPVQNIYVRRVEKRALFGYAQPELWNIVIKTYPNISQFWPWSAEEYLKQPIYTRDWPPCRHCK
ncbi:MAG: ABC transporter substrate-binding protein [Candidatus Tectomicrobia bacterium]|nr:ABC transporter substrate-binding protein [Candidatus Tectomicrobia bacterium]